MSIKSGTIRRAYNDALEKHIICRNQLLISLSALRVYKEYTVEDKLKLGRILKEHGYGADYLGLVLPQITEEYYPTKEQINKLFSVVDGEYQYQDGFIKDALLKSVRVEDLTGTKNTSKRKKYLSAGKLKWYIYKEEAIEFVLTSIKCHDIKLSQDKKRYSCSNHDGDRIGAIQVNNNPYIGVVNYTRQKYFKSNADIIDLVQYNMQCDFKTAMSFLHSILKLTDDKIENIDFSSLSEPVIHNEDTEKGECFLIPIDENELNRYDSILFIGWFKEGIMEWTRKKFDLRFSYDENCVIIPIRRWDDGSLVAINKRTVEEHWEEFGIPKYRITKGYNKQLNVYGIWENKETIKEAGYAVIYEAEKSTLKRHSRNDGTGVSIQGHNLSDEQVNILTNLEVDLIVSMDADVSIDEVKFMCKKLYEKNKGKVYYTVDNHGLMGEKDSVADLSKQDYDLILSEKVLFDEEAYEEFLEKLNN